MNYNCIMERLMEPQLYEVATTTQDHSPPERASKPINSNPKTSLKFDMLVIILRLPLSLQFRQPPGFQHSMTCDRLCGWRSLGENQVPNECAHCNCNHDLPIICHEEKPNHQVSGPKRGQRVTRRHLHDEEAIEHLDGIQSRQGKLALACQCRSVFPSCKQW